MEFIKIIFCFIYGMYIFNLSTEASSVEVCYHEAFNASCSSESVLIISDARYGRMARGRCISGKGGHLGCFTDVLEPVHKDCSGRQSCQFPVTRLANFKPCDPEFRDYLEVAYECRKVPVLPAYSCQRDAGLKLPGKNGSLIYPIPLGGSTSGGGLTFPGPGTSACPLTVSVDAGQRVNITAFIFTPALSEQFGLSFPSSCPINLVIQDNEVVGRTREISLCRDTSSRHKFLYISESNSVTFFVSTSQVPITTSEPAFILEYKAVGCADLARPMHGWVRRTGDISSVHCNFTEETWYLTCAEGRWIGDFRGNCSKGLAHTHNIENGSSLISYGIIFAVFLGVVLGVFIGALMLGIVHWYRRGRSNEGRNNKFTMVPQIPKAKNGPLSQRSAIPALLIDSHMQEGYPIILPDTDIYDTKIRTVSPHERCIALSPVPPCRAAMQEGTMYHRVEGKLYECPATSTCAKCDLQTSRYTCIDSEA